MSVQAGKRATTSSMSATAKMMRRMPSVFAGAFGSALAQRRRVELRQLKPAVTRPEPAPLRRRLGRRRARRHGPPTARVLVPVVALIPFWVHFQKLVALLCRSTGQNATRTRFGTQNGQISRTRRPLAAARINALLGAFRETRCTSVRIRGATATRTDPCTEKPGLASGLIDTFGRVAGAVGLAAIATIAASAAHDHGPAVTLSAGLTSGYDRAFAAFGGHPGGGCGSGTPAPPPDRRRDRPCPSCRRSKGQFVGPH